MRTRFPWAVVSMACVIGSAACSPSVPPQQGTAGTTSAPTPAPASEGTPQVSPGPLPSNSQSQTPLSTTVASSGASTSTPARATTPAESIATRAGDPATPPAAEVRPVGSPTPAFREVTVPAGTALSVVLDTAVSSTSSSVEDHVRGHLASTVRVKGAAALPAGSALSGVVVDAQSAGKVKGRGRIGFRFTSITAHDETLDARTSTYTARARATKGKDAKKIGIGAGAGAIVGGILGGGKGAAIGAGVGGGAGTAVVLGTKGEEVRVPAGARVRVTLREPLTVRVPVSTGKP